MIDSRQTRRARLIIALPDTLLASSLAEILRVDCPDVVLAATWNAFEDTLARLNPCIALVDVALDGVVLIQHLDKLVTAFGETHFIVCTSHPDQALVTKALLAGAAAVVGHDVGGADLRQGLRALIDAKPWPDGVGHPAVRHSRRAPPLKPLTPRLRQLEQLLWDGLTYSEIAAALRLSPKTIEAEVGKLRRAHCLPAFTPAPWQKRQRGRPPRP